MIQNRHISLNRLKRQMFLRDHFNWRFRLFASMYNNKSWQLPEALSKHSRAFCWTMETSTCIIKMILRWTFCCREDPVGLPWLFGWWEFRHLCLKSPLWLDHWIFVEAYELLIASPRTGMSWTMALRMIRRRDLFWSTTVARALWCKRGCGI